MSENDSHRGAMTAALWRRRRSLGLLLVALLASAAAIASRHSSVVAGMERQTIDTRFTLRGAQRVSNDVVIVGLDDNSLGHLPRFPFTRALHAQVIDRLHAAGARLIVYDFSFDRPTTVSADDALASAAARAAPVVFGTTLIDNGQTEVLGGAANLRGLGASAAAALLPLDPDGVIRHLTSEVDGLPTIAAVVQRLMTGHATAPRRVAGTGAWLDFAGPPGRYPVIPFLDVLGGRFDRGSVRGKIVIVGPTASVLQDYHATAAGGQMSGAEVQANAIATLLDGLPLLGAPAWLEIVLIVIGAFGVCAVALRLSAVWVGLVGVASLLGWCVAVLVAFDHGLVLQFTPEVLALVLATLGALLIAAVADARERRRLRELFATASPDVVAQVLGAAGGAPLSPTKIIAGYRMDELLATGGMGVVYRATQIALGRTVAIKLIRPERATDSEYRSRFERECRATAAVEHANVIPVYEAGEDDGLLFIAMRLVNGVDLRELIRRGGPLEPSRAARIIEAVAGALDAAHATGLIHRDVKPANVLVTVDEPEHVYLTDFGIAKQLGSNSDLTQADRWLGTADYLAPEQIQGHDLDRRADVYALTAVLYDCLTGEPPYRRDNVAATLLAHMSADVPRPTEHDARLPEAIDAVIAKGMAKDPADRYPTASELAAAASRALGVPSRLPEAAAERLRPAAPTTAPTEVAVG